MASGPEPEGVVTVRRSGGSLITTIPARVARRLGIRKGMELTVYLTYDEDLDTEAILYVPKRGRGPRPARESPGDEGQQRASGGRVLSSDPQAGTRTGPDEQLVSELPGTEPGAERLTARLAEVVE